MGGTPMLPVGTAARGRAKNVVERAFVVIPNEVRDLIFSVV